jgi:hypothetical protein
MRPSESTTRNQRSLIAPYLAAVAGGHAKTPDSFL